MYIRLCIKPTLLLMFFTVSICPSVSLLLLATLSQSTNAASFPQFRRQVIDPYVGKVCYAVTVTDVDGDRRNDIVAISENRVLWYQNPDWKKRVVIEDQTERDNVCIAPVDFDRDGKIDFALGAGWTKTGTLQWLSRGKTLEDRWHVHPIGEEPWTHRIRLADVLGIGEPQLVISPLNKTQGAGVRLTAFTVPPDPAQNQWPRTVLDASLNRMHNHWHFRENNTEVVSTLTASQEGVHRFQLLPNGQWIKERLHSGAQGETPTQSGAGEIKTGHLVGGEMFITTIEPMHGDRLVLYTKKSDRWQRRVLDDMLRRGHAIWTADVDQDGADEIVVGHSDVGPGPVKGPGVYVFDLENEGNWRKHVIDDGGIATEDLVATDLTEDGLIDVVAGGRASHNLVLYVNQSAPSRGYTIPLVDLAHQTDRQVTVDREPGQYLGHPTTVLLEDNKTMITVFPKGHGRGPIVMKRSTDAGLTWSDRLPVPENWATSKEVPTIYRTVDSQGQKRLIMFSGLYPIRMAVSDNDGMSWSSLRDIGDYGGIVAMSSVERLKNGQYMALFHDDGRFIRKESKKENPPVFLVYKVLSCDGGLTWSQPQVIASHCQAHLCEPGVVRSPNGKQIAVLLRENSRQFNSFVIFSDDEGVSWSAPRELPGALTGDRHIGKYGPNGRLFITFRDTTLDSPTAGDWVGWVGTYDDIVQGLEGQYRVRLMENHRAKDCAYPGLELLPDGTFVTTTYGHWAAGEQPYIVSVRFTLDELDSLAKGKR